MTWKTFGDWAFYGCAVSSAIFVISYAFLAPWWERATGRNIMALMASLSAAMIYFAVVISVKGVPTSFYPVRAVLFMALFTSISWRVLLLVRAQVTARQDAKEADHGSVADQR